MTESWSGTVAASCSGTVAVSLWTVIWSGTVTKLVRDSDAEAGTASDVELVKGSDSEAGKDSDADMVKDSEAETVRGQ